ncbi:hypothetical protein E0493_03215 [Roseomonas sp. M0104]|uniref:Cytochrome c domain-containing protein n=1 Tax=Teichococcus coralli TaxID=2545983 RepID=A0A845BAF2_9PROT|nr:c-type cytochrome [Pseudoroseomonas coralli]MXP62362.1 hypothetical protein [Pseudoroseomonas coralli]
MFRLQPYLALLLALATVPAPAQEVPLHGAPVRALAVAADGARLASGGFDQAVIVWPADLSRPLQVSRWHRGAVQALVALPGGGFASGDTEGRIALWPVAGAPSPERVLEGHQSAIAALAARDGLLLSAAWDGTARLWNLADGGVRVLEGHAGQVTAAAFRADGLPVTAGADGTLRGWPAGAAPLALAAFGLPQTALAALPDGTLASAGVDGVVRLLAPDGTLRRLEAGRLPLAALAASADGTLLAAAGPAGDISVWTLPAGRLRHSLPSAGQAVWALGFSPDGGRLFAGGADRRLRAFDMRRGTAMDTAPPPPPEGLAELDEAGARAFRACGACHSLSAPAAGQTDLKAGPHLAGLFGRRMGSVPGYPYSERLRRGDRVWTPEGVAELFTHGPDVVLPGTRMPVQVLDNPDEMAALLRFLQQATRP